MESINSKSVHALNSDYYRLSKEQICYLNFKRCVDLLFASIALIILLVPFMLIAIMQKISSVEEPIIFKQERIGKDGLPFSIYKFRSMKVNAPAYTSTSEFHDADAYISTMGRFLRTTSIDELPQIFNVIKGDMSIIGPRPLIPQEKTVHELRYKYGVYQIRPGITGWAQINGRDKVSDKQKAELDKEYLIKLSLKLDVQIVLNSVIKVLRRDGIKN